MKIKDCLNKAQLEKYKNFNQIDIRQAKVKKTIVTDENGVERVETTSTPILNGGVPAGLVHIDIKRAGLSAKKLGIEFAKAQTDHGQRFPICSGIVILKEDEQKLMDYLNSKKVVDK